MADTRSRHAREIRHSPWGISRLPKGTSKNPASPLIGCINRMRAPIGEISRFSELPLKYPRADPSPPACCSFFLRELVSDENLLKPTVYVNGRQIVRTADMMWMNWKKP